MESDNTEKTKSACVGLALGQKKGKIDRTPSSR